MKPVLILLIFFGSVSYSQQKEPDLKLEGFSHPESVVYDEQRQEYYVSNIGDKQEGDGFISKVSKNGKKTDHSWITGLNDPKGLLIAGNHLYVSDVNRLVKMDMESGKIISEIPVKGSKSLNDLTKDEAGNIYFSDLAKSSIYVLKPSGEIEEWLNSDQLENPNGLLMTRDYLLVAAWGKEEPGHFLQVDRHTKEIGQISKGIGNLDGLQQIEEGAYYISDWASGKIYKISLEGTLEEVLTTAKSSGDIYYDNKDQKLYVPMNRQNEVWIYTLK